MTELFFIKNLNDVPSLPTEWENPILSGYPQIITREGKQLFSGPDCSNYKGRKYQVIAKHILYYSFCERIARIFKGIYAVISTFGYTLADEKSREDIYQLFFERIKLSKTFAKRYDYNDYVDYYKPFPWQHTPQITSGMIKFLETDPSFEQFKLRCKETGFVVNSDEWTEALEPMLKGELLLAIASVSDINILSYFLAKNRSKGEIDEKTPLLKSVLLRYLDTIQYSSLDIDENTCNKIKLLIGNGAELNPEWISKKIINQYFNNCEPVLSFFLNRAFSSMKIWDNEIEVFVSNVVSVAHLFSTIRPVVHFLLTNKAKTIKEKYPNDDLSVYIAYGQYRLKDLFLTTIFVDACRHESVVINFLQAGRSDPGSVLFNFNDDILNLILKIFLELGVSSSVFALKFSDMEFTHKLLEAKKKANPWGFGLLIGGEPSRIKEKQLVL